MLMKAEIDLIQPLGMEQPIAHLLGEKSRTGRNPHVWPGALVLLLSAVCQSLRSSLMVPYILFSSRPTGQNVQ
jgi:hypothetical protein